MFTTRIYTYLSDDCRSIREQVFMKEQGFENEFDQIDQSCTHIVVYDENGAPIGTGRLFSENDGEFFIGRVPVLREYRGRKIGLLIISGLEKEAVNQNASSISLWAQCRASGFYEKSGYTATDQFHDDEGCPHVLMRKEL
ncbi:GNAT family N-acetyltransferase [Ruminococcus flavefaciens]|uniref:GNAT family N-acetyltransferase n=1 Tax=Ruminococcus flavefaciens TaxID=1265 RepID=UPI00156394D2|nr:GNAT family N-acetyltransferase [Ruminococcus flavefaciens]